MPLFCHVYNSQAPRPGIVHSICRAAGLLREITNAETAVINKVPVSFVHTAAVVFIWGKDNLIRRCLYMFKLFYIRLRPSPCLIPTRKNKDQLNIRVRSFLFKDCLRCQRVKVQSSTGSKITVAPVQWLQSKPVLTAFWSFASAKTACSYDL